MCSHISEKKDYYGMFFNELAINKKIARSQLVPISQNFLFLVTGGAFSIPMHIFEYIGREILDEKWNKKKVYKIIKRASSVGDITQ